MDIVDSPTRSRMMAGITGKDTARERRVRRYLHASSLRFRLHDRQLPGVPDLVFPGRRLVVLVHGCFWHRHAGCRFATMPATREDFWAAKFNANIRRDTLVREQLDHLGWTVETIWECETRDEHALDRLCWRILSCDPESRQPAISHTWARSSKPNAS
jgi:DNA mismatch endonuclease, patch repair protein